MATDFVTSPNHGRHCHQRPGSLPSLSRPQPADRSCILVVGNTAFLDLEPTQRRRRHSHHCLSIHANLGSRVDKASLQHPPSSGNLQVPLQAASKERCWHVSPRKKLPRQKLTPKGTVRQLQQEVKTMVMERKQRKPTLQGSGWVGKGKPGRAVSAARDV